MVVNSTYQNGFWHKVSLFTQLVGERSKAVYLSGFKKDELSLSVQLIGNCLRHNFTIQERLLFACLLFGVFFFCSYCLEFVTYHEIDKTLRSQQAAKAESLIRQRLMFMPDNNDLKLRLAHAYLALDRVYEAKSIVEVVQVKDPHNSYLPKIAIDLAQALKRNNQSYRALIILEKLPANKCKECPGEMLELYTIEGRKALIEGNLERSSYFLNRALKLAEQSQESTSSLNHRKHELARAYNLQANEYIKAQQISRAIKVLEESKKIFPIAQTYLMLAKLYYTRQSGPEDLKQALDCYEKAYSFGATEVETDYKQALNKLKQSLKQEGLSVKEVESQTKKFTLENKPQINLSVSKEDRELPKELPPPPLSIQLNQPVQPTGAPDRTSANNLPPLPPPSSSPPEPRRLPDSSSLQMDDPATDDGGVD